MAYSPVGRSDNEAREFVAGAIFGVAVLLLVVLIVLVAFGHVDPSFLSYDWIPEWREPPVGSDARPTPSWPFREEWLTPRPKA